MVKEGFMIRVLGSGYEKATIFKETKPTELELEALIKEYQGIRAFISRTEMYVGSSQTEQTVQ